MPFVTEEIWQKLPINKSVDSIMISTFPEALKIKSHLKTVEDIRMLKGVITSIRMIRSQNQIPPSTKLSIHAWNNKGSISELQNFEQQLKKLCSIESVQYSPIADRKNAAYGVFENIEIGFSLEGLVDKSAEADRLGKEISKARQDMEFLKKRLNDDNYKQKAPPQLIQKDLDKLNMAVEKLSKLEKSLTDLQS